MNRIIWPRQFTPLQLTCENIHFPIFSLGNVQNEFLRARKDFLDLQRYRRLRFERSKDAIDGAFSSAGTITCVGTTDQQCSRQGDERQNQSLQFNVARSDFPDKIAPLTFNKASTLGTDSCPNVSNRKFDRKFMDTGFHKPKKNTPDPKGIGH